MHQRLPTMLLVNSNVLASVVPATVSSALLTLLVGVNALRNIHSAKELTNLTTFSQIPAPAVSVDLVRLKIKQVNSSLLVVSV